jgi:hypothetical protein
VCVYTDGVIHGIHPVRIKLLHLCVCVCVCVCVCACVCVCVHLLHNRAEGIVDDMVGAQGLHVLGVLGRARADDHCPCCLGDLNACGKREG